MADYSELAQPGIEVLQVIQTTNPTVVVPTLMPCISGICRQVVPVFTTDASGGRTLNSQALVSVPAYVIDPTPSSSYSGANLQGRTVLVEVDGAPSVSFTFPVSMASTVSAQTIADMVNESFVENNLYQDAYADVFGLAFGVRTRGAGDQMSLRFTPGQASDRVALNELGIAEGHTYRGYGNYSQNAVEIPKWAYPDPRGNLNELAVEMSTVRSFVYLGSGIDVQEGYQNQAFLRWGIRTDTKNALTDVLVIDDGNGDPISPIVQLTGEDLTAASTTLSVTGTVDVHAGVTFTDDKLLTLDWGDGPQSLYCSTNPTDGAGLLTLLNGAFADKNNGGQLPAGHGLVFSLAAGVSPIEYLKIATIGGSITPKQGVDAVLQVVGGHAATNLGFTAMASRQLGDRMSSGTAPYDAQPHPVKAGDLLYIDGVYKGKILQVNPRGPSYTGEVKLDTQYPITAGGSHFGTSYFIVARNLPQPLVNDRPAVDLVVDSTSGKVTFKPNLIRDTSGRSLGYCSLATYLSYNAVREDVSANAPKPSLLNFDTATQIETLIAPVDTTNPLALGSFFALLNSSGARVQSIAVDAKSDSQPYGTTEAWERVFTFLESKEVYALAPLTHDIAVAQISNVHALTMSDPENKGERIIIFNLPMPTHASDTLVCSGTMLNSVTGLQIDTGIANLSALLLAQGIDPHQTIPVKDTTNLKGGLCLHVEGDDNRYNIASVSGSVVTIRGSFVAGENDDQYYWAGATLPDQPWIGGTFNLSIRGAELVLTNGQPDKDAIANAYQDLGKSFGSRRFWNLVLETAEASLDGITQQLEGFYMCAAYAGMIGGQPPQQSFTNFPITGFTKVTGTNDYFSTRQLNRIAAGGNTIIVQDPLDDGPIFSRMSLTTDVTSVETRTDNITKALDFTAKFLRKGLRIFIGRYNISQGYLDTLSHVIQGLLAFLTGANVLVDAEINNLIQDENDPDAVTLDITADPPYPCNYIRVRLIV